MAGVIKVDTIQSDTNVALKIATANVAFIDATGINVVGGNLSVGGTQFASGGQIQTAGIADGAITTAKITNGAVTNDKIVSVANTKISGNIVSSQIAPEQTFYGNTVISGTGSYLRLASGTGGIQFGGDTSAANALDDYEEGTWTATHIAVAGITGTPTYSQTTYTKIGRVVTLQIRIDVNVTSANTTSYVVFSGAPFVQAQISTAFGIANNGGQVINGQIYSGGQIFIGAPAASALPSGTDIWYATLIYAV